MILCIKADSPEVEIEFVQNSTVIASKHWLAGRELSIQINSVIDSLCAQIGIAIADISGIIVFNGPGSYTGLRISVSVANAIGYSLGVAVAGCTGENWRLEGQKNLQKTTDFQPIVPVYGGQIYITTPKK